MAAEPGNQSCAGRNTGAPLHSGSRVELTEALLSKAAGWEAMKLARAYLAQGQVLNSAWEPPRLRGVVRAGDIAYSASLVIQGPIDIENLCTCRDARQWGKICAHSVAAGLHWLKQQSAGAAPPRSPAAVPPPESAAKPSSLLRAANGEPAELFVILPPNFEQAVARGKVTLVFEARWAGGRALLNALPKGRPFAFDTRDSALIDRLESLAGGDAPALLQLDTSGFAALLPLLAGHERATLGKGAAVRVIREPLVPLLRATLEANGEITLAPREPAAGGVLIGEWLWRNHTLQPIALPPALRDALRQPVRVSRTEAPLFLSHVWPALGAAVEADFKPEDFSLAPQAPRFLLELAGGLAQLAARLQCAYGPRVMTPGVPAPNEDVWLPDPSAPTRYATRDTRAEQAALARLQRAGFSAPDAQGRMRLNGQDAVLDFFAREFPKLEREWSVTLEERLERGARHNLERIEPRFQITPSGVQWFDLGVVFAASGGETFTAADIQRLLLSGQSRARLRSGKLALIDPGEIEELRETLLDCAPQQHAGGYRIRREQAGFVEETLRAHPGWRVEAPPAWRERAARQSGGAELECPPLGSLDAVLRPYQKQGVAWLQFLRANGFGGVLADEMGLGKTPQTLAHLWLTRNAERETPGGNRAPHLIVCPASLVFNWTDEARKFTPELKVLALHGADRHSAFDRIPEHDLVVTSYALVRRDAGRYRGIEFDTVVLDEAQHIKNRHTRNAKAVKAVKSRHRLVLTGTPMENSVLDLWSIFDFLMPGYLGAAADFRERYETPVARERNAAAQTRLARRLRPFVLRRLKREVAKELPAKLEQVAPCELTAEQRAVYQQIIEAARKEMLEAAGEAGEARGRMVALNALLRLRQVCCDPRLLKLDGIEPEPASGKLALFSELLEEVIDGGHRALVFSQFVSMLTLLRERLDAEGIEFCYLDGSTTDRAAVVERFQKTPAIPVFLISLKAGGTGLNLTGADTVIHFDPWWNPAVEDQATDRAHRIGQTRAVTSYKLIARDTVEEKILTLQSRKRELIAATLGGEEEFTAALNWDEIRELLA